MGKISSTLSIRTPGGSALRASINKEANSTLDREIALSAGEFVEVFSMDTLGAQGGATPIPNSLPDFKQIVAYNAGQAPIEIVLKNALIDDADGLVHAEIYAYTTFFIQAGGYLSLPSPRMVTTTGVDTSPEALNYVTDVANRCTSQLTLRATASTATYESRDGKIKKYGLSTAAITDSAGDVYINGIHGKANYNNNTGAGGAAATWVATDGVVPGTIRVRFFQGGFQQFDYTENGLAPQTSTSTTLLAANTAYAFGINVNGAGAGDVSFTTHTSDVTWGNPSSGTGVLYKIQVALDALLKDTDVALVDGNLRFTSRSRSSIDSAIALTAPSSGTDFRASGINAAAYLAATAAEVLDGDDADIMFDDGQGNLSRANGGTGWCTYGIPGSGTAVKFSIYITGGPPNSSIQLSWLHGSVAGGNLSTTTPADDGEATNSLLAVYARAIAFSLEHGNAGRKGKLRLIVVDNTDITQANY